MSLNVKIKDGDGTGNTCFVNSFRALRVTNHVPELQPSGSLNRKRLHSEVLSGLNVDGSTIPVEFKIEGDQTEEYDLFITRIVITISDGTTSHSKYGAISKLSNGTDFYVVENGVKTFLIEKAKTGGELIVKSGMFSPYGDGSTVGEVTSWSSNDNAQVVVMDFNQIITGGLRIGRGTFDYFGATVNDNLTALSDHFVQVIGYRLYE